MLLNINTKTHYTEKKRTSRLQDFGLDERALQNILFKSLDRLFPDDELILRLSPPILVKIDLIMPKTQYSKNENLNKEDEIAVIKNKTTTPNGCVCLIFFPFLVFPLLQIANQMPRTVNKQEKNMKTLIPE